MAPDHEVAPATLASCAVRTRKCPARGRGEDPLKWHVTIPCGLGLSETPQRRAIMEPVAQLRTILQRILGKNFASIQSVVLSQRLTNNLTCNRFSNSPCLNSAPLQLVPQPFLNIRTE